MIDDEEALRSRAAAGDADAMFELATRLEERARQFAGEARGWLERGVGAGSLDALHGVVRLAVAERDYDLATSLLRQARERSPGLPAERYVSVAPDVLGRDLPLDGDGVSDLPGAGVFTVITPEGWQAVQTLAPVAPRLLGVDEFGVLHPPDWIPPSGADPPYTPNSLGDLEWTYFAVMIILDTKGEMTAAMGRTMVRIVVNALAAGGIAAHVTGACPDVRPLLSAYQA